MKIYDVDGAPNPARIRIVLKEKGLEDQVEFVRVDLIDAEQKTDEFLAMNPLGKISVFELDDGTIVSEATAITEYLDNLDGRPVFTGKTSREKALIHMWQRRVEQLLLEPIDDYFHYATPGLGSKVQPWRMTEWEGRHEWGRRRGAFAVRHLSYFDNELAMRPFIAGDAFSMADITLFVSLYFGEIAGVTIAPELTTLATWRAEVSEIFCVKDRSGKDLSPSDLDRLVG